MKPEIALKLQYSLLDKYTREQIETIRDEWITVYREIAKSDSSKKELCDSLTDRISRAAELFIRESVLQLLLTHYADLSQCPLH